MPWRSPGAALPLAAAALAAALAALPAAPPAEAHFGTGMPLDAEGLAWTVLGASVASVHVPDICAPDGMLRISIGPFHAQFHANITVTHNPCEPDVTWFQINLVAHEVAFQASGLGAVALVSGAAVNPEVTLTGTFEQTNLVLQEAQATVGYPGLVLPFPAG